MQIASFKLRVADVHVRIVPDVGDDGCPFAGPGVDVRGPDARAILDAAGSLLRALTDMEPGVVVRSLSVDRRRPRVLATLDPAPALSSRAAGDVALRVDERPRVVRVDGGALLDRMLALAEPLVSLLEHHAREAIARRPSTAERTS